MFYKNICFKTCVLLPIYYILYYILYQYTIPMYYTNILYTIPILCIKVFQRIKYFYV